jgi:hypothetical protein
MVATFTLPASRLSEPNPSFEGMAGGSRPAYSEISHSEAGVSLSEGEMMLLDQSLGASS